MCYYLYKNGKNKPSNNCTRCQSENQYGRKPAGDSNTYPITVNQSYGKHIPATASFDEDPPQTHIPATASFDEDPPQTMYEAVNMH